MTIDPEVSVMELLRAYKKHPEVVLAALEQDHPGLVAMFLVTGIGERMLDRSDCNTITNLLMDRRREIAQGG